MAWTNEDRAAYYSGKNAGHDYAEAPARFKDAFKVCRYSDTGLIAKWRNGWADAMREERLNACTEWD